MPKFNRQAQYEKRAKDSEKPLPENKPKFVNFENLSLKNKPKFVNFEEFKFVNFEKCRD